MIFHLKIFYHTEGKLLRIPGLPAMYDYECSDIETFLREMLVQHGERLVFFVRFSRFFGV